MPNFKGDYINYGYWQGIDLTKPITVEERIKSSINLYKKVIQHFNFTKHDHVVEVGCGRGVGIIDVLSKLSVEKIIGIDINPAQIVRSKRNIVTRLQSSDNIILSNVSATNTALSSHSVDKICSIEVAQHFSSIINFAMEMKRILKHSGELAFATYFLTDRKYLAKLKPLLPLISEDLENTSTINQICEYLIEAGFDNVSYESIGEHTFPGYDKWLTQVETTSFSYNYYKAFQAGYIDYYIIKAF